MSLSDKRVLIYDGKCGFCKIWIEYWKNLTGQAIDYAASQDVAAEYPQIPAEGFSESVQLVLPSGQVLSGARAVFETLALGDSGRWLLRLYRHVPGFAAIAEAAYRIIARNRSFFYYATVILFGRRIEPLQFHAIQWIFRKALAIVWLIAFVSFGVQAAALIGSHGVQPVSLYLARVREFLGSGGWLAAPSVFWFGTNDAYIHGVWIAGAICSVLAISGLFWRGALFLAFVLYLSLFNVSQEFLSYQWDILLLETGFLSIFIGYSRAVVWLFRWLLFRLMFLSGAVKLLSGDPAWHSLTALLVHFQTQPIPTPLAWYAHQLPAWFLKASCFLVLAIELLIPFLVFAPRRVRAFAVPWLVGLQILILLTGNYAFFNLLLIILCLFLFDDAQLKRVFPSRWMERACRPDRAFVPVRVRRAVAVSVTVLIAVLSSLHFIHAIRRTLPAGAAQLVSIAAPFGFTSSYGLFASMTTTRPEIVIEGSIDGTRWLEYEFRYKPGRLDRAPPWVAPHQPRLDWQMWFAALGRYTENVWFLNLLARLLQGDAEVLAQLERNPFPDAPPRLVRARMYEYRFTDWASRQRTGNWWTRSALPPYLRAVSLDDLSVLPLLRSQQGESAGTGRLQSR